MKRNVVFFLFVGLNAGICFSQEKQNHVQPTSRTETVPASAKVAHTNKTTQNEHFKLKKIEAISREEKAIQPKVQPVTKID